MFGIAPVGLDRDLRRRTGSAAVASAAAGLSLLALVTFPTAVAGASPDNLRPNVIDIAGALPDSELDGYRGGFEVGGFMINFGAEVRTLFEGKELVSRIDFGDQVRGSITSSLKDLATGQQIAVSGADQNAKIVQAVTGGANVTYDFRSGILSMIKNTNNNVTVDSKVTLNVGISNYQSMLRAAQTRAMLDNIAAHLRQTGTRR